LKQFDERKPLYEDIAKYHFVVPKYVDGDDQYWDKVQSDFNTFIDKIKDPQNR